MHKTIRTSRLLYCFDSLPKRGARPTYLKYLPFRHPFVLMKNGFFENFTTISPHSKRFKYVPAKNSLPTRHKPQPKICRQQPQQTPAFFQPKKTPDKKSGAFPKGYFRFLYLLSAKRETFSIVHLVTWLFMFVSTVSPHLCSRSACASGVW